MLDFALHPVSYMAGLIYISYPHLIRDWRGSGEHRGGLAEREREGLMEGSVGDFSISLQNVFNQSKHVSYT